MGIRLIVAMAKNRVIGDNNKMLWHLPGDFAYFKKTTLGKPIIMGRKTFESIGRPLPGRKNIVLTRNNDWRADGVVVADNMGTALQIAGCENTDDIMVIGGGNIFVQTIGMADTLYITEVDKQIKGDTVFPEIDEKLWAKQSVSADMTENGISYRFVVYSKKG